MNYTQDQIDERIQKLPKELQDVLFGPKIAEQIFSIGVKFGLNIEQAGILGEETGNIILGFTRPEDFAKVLQGALQTDEATTKKIAGDINASVLIPLRELLKSAHQFELGPSAGAPVFMQKPTTALPPEAKPEWIIRPELKQPGIPPKVVLPEKEVQIPLPVSPKPAPPKPVAVPSVVDLKKQALPKIPDAVPSKVPPIDLRTQVKIPASPAPLTTPPPSPAKTIPDKGMDPYREPLE